ncbi:hypothetical protein KQX54_005864 [Cotesia glomerata]|uniref:Secreted protein n=1 Tax=Cotesia glomerata TaxID=32391 RepID=A0AAV7IJB2_COTGL|nr:hypothetical protein KQX54_005864 [Cotesia glomerata]
MRIHWRASLVPAAAVIPAPIAYIKVVAVKKLVVEFVFHTIGSSLCGVNWDRWGHSYCDVRGEILGSSQDEQKRKHLPKMFSLIKNES